MPRVTDLRLTAAVVLSALVANAAEARINSPPGNDPLAIECGGLQDEFDSLQRQLHDPTTSNATKGAISARLAEVTDHWNSVCSGKYGGIAALTVPQGQNLGGSFGQTLDPGSRAGTLRQLERAPRLGTFAPVQ